MSLFSYFEKRLDSFPDITLPKTTGSLASFIYACTIGFRGWLLLFTLLTALSGLYWAFVYAWVGQIIDWMSVYSPSQLWADKKTALITMIAISVFVLSLNLIMRHF